MTLATMKSETARLKWRDMLDIAHTGGEVVIERYDKPIAVLVSHKAWEQWRVDKIRLRKLELEADARRVNAAINSGEMGTISHEDLKRLMMEKRANVGA